MNEVEIIKMLSELLGPEVTPWERIHKKMLNRNKKAEFNRKPLFTKTDYEIVRNAMQELPPMERVIVYLHFWEGQSCSDICGELGLSWRLVQSCLSRALLRMRKRCVSDPVFSRTDVLSQAA